MVAIFLLYMSWAQRFCPALSCRDQARVARYPDGHGSVRDGAGAGRATARRRRLRTAIRLPAPVAEGTAYNAWRDFDPEGPLRFWALWMHQFGMLNSTP